MPERYILCDSSSLISLTDSCLDGILSFFSHRDVDFIIPPGVKEEIIDRPLRISMKAYQFSAMRLKRLLEEGVIMEVKAKTQQEAEEILKIANALFFARGKPIHLVDFGEAEMIALANKLNVSTLLMDERTTRMLIEAPFVIKDHLEDELGVNVMVNENNLRRFQDIVKNMEVIRSSELVTVAYELGYFDKFGEEKEKALEAALYKLKFSGCSLRFDEIEEVMRLEQARPHS